MVSKKQRFACAFKVNPTTSGLHIVLTSPTKAEGERVQLAFVEITAEDRCLFRIGYADEVSNLANRILPAGLTDDSAYPTKAEIYKSATVVERADEADIRYVAAPANTPIPWELVPCEIVPTAGEAIYIYLLPDSNCAAYVCIEYIEGV